MVLQGGLRLLLSLWRLQLLLLVGLMMAHHQQRYPPVSWQLPTQQQQVLVLSPAQSPPTSPSPTTLPWAHLLVGEV
jgi:hypothetical protein